MWTDAEKPRATMDAPLPVGAENGKQMPVGAENGLDEPVSPPYRVTRHEIYEVVYEPCVGLSHPRLMFPPPSIPSRSLGAWRSGARRR